MLHFVGGRLKPISLGSAGREGCFLDLGSSCNKFLVVSVSEIRRRCFEGDFACMGEQECGRAWG